MSENENIIELVNNASVKESCPLCGTSFKPIIGLWGFLNGDYGKPICGLCYEQFKMEAKK